MYQRLFELESDTFKVIANQKRLEIIQLLQNRELTVSEMVEMLGIRQANLSQHLALLRQHQVVTTRRAGLNVHYRLADRRIARATRLIRDFLAEQYNLQPELSRALRKDIKSPYPVVRDIVCGMRMSVSEASGKAKFGGQTFFFCGAGCQGKFRRHPRKFVKMEKTR